VRVSPVQSAVSAADPSLLRASGRETNPWSPQQTCHACSVRAAFTGVIAGVDRGGPIRTTLACRGLVRTTAIGRISSTGVAGCSLAPGASLARPQ
jgi:hypothetical protein